MSKRKSLKLSAKRRAEIRREEAHRARRWRWILGLVAGTLIGLGIVLVGQLTSLSPQSSCGSPPQIAVQNVTHLIRISGGTITFTFNFTLNNSNGGAGVVTLDFWMNNNTRIDEKSYNVGAGRVVAESEVYSIENVTSIPGSLTPTINYVSEAPNC